MACDEEVVRVGKTDVIVRGRDNDIGWLGELQCPVRPEGERVASRLEQVFWDEEAADLVVVRRGYDGGSIASPGVGQPRCIVSSKSLARVCLYVPMCGLIE